MDACVADVFYVSFTDELTQCKEKHHRDHRDHFQQHKTQNECYHQRLVGSKRQRQQKLEGKGVHIDFRISENAYIVHAV